MKFNDRLNAFYSEKIPGDYVHGFGTKKTPDLSRLIDYKVRIAGNQSHKDQIKVIENEPKTPFTNVGAFDGFVTDKFNYFLEVFTADCVPIIFVDPKKRRVGISHQGWKGTLIKMPEKMIGTFLGKGSKVSDIIVSVGPSIGLCCYRISASRAFKFIKKFPKYKKRILKKTNGSYHLNLAILNCLILISCGIKEDNIDYSGSCTKCNDALFYSFRRDGENKKKEMRSFVMMKKLI